MDTNLVQDIRKNMESKSTEELVRIWQENDRTQYSEEAFEAICQILEERGETLPPQFPAKKEETTKDEEDGFFSFRTMISTTLIKIIYVFGMVGLTISGIVMIVQTSQSIYSFGEKVLIGLALIVLFNMHDILGSIEKELKRRYLIL